MNIPPSTTSNYLNGKGNNPLKNKFDLKYKHTHTNEDV